MNPPYGRFKSHRPHHIVAFDAPTNPDWYYNLVGSPEVTVEVGTKTFRVLATVAEEPELTRLYNKMVEVMPAFDDYRHKTMRKIPVVVLTPVK